MINKIKEIWCEVVGSTVCLPLFVIWLSACILGSAIKVGDGHCDKNYPIERYFITNLFCEIKRGEHE